MKEKLQTSPVTNVLDAHVRSAALPGVITKRINRLAHSRAMDFEQTMRKDVTSKLQRLAENGASVPELLAEIERILTSR